MTVTCEYCNKVLSNKSNLKAHQKTKACLSTRDDAESLGCDYHCGHCNRYLSTAYKLRMHQVKCIKRFENEIAELHRTIVSQALSKDEIIGSLQLRISELEQQNKSIRLETQVEMLRRNDEQNREVISEIAKQPKTTNNTTNNLVLPVIDQSQEAIDDAVQHYYSRNHFLGGQRGVADFAKKHILTNNHEQLGYVCTDPARATFKHMSLDGKVIKDVKAVNLTKKLARPIKVKAAGLAEALVAEYKGNPDMFSTITGHYQEVSVLDDDSSKFCTRLCAVTTQ